MLAQGSRERRSALRTSARRAAPAAQRPFKLEALDDEPIYPGTCRHASWHAPQLPGPTGVDLERPEGANWRFRVPDGEVVEFDDQNLGPQRFVAGVDFGDFVVWRRDGVPSYQLACVADDAAMGITEVVRGADLLKSTARQILLYRALGVARSAVVSLPPGGGSQRPPAGQAPRCPQPPRPAPAAA